MLFVPSNRGKIATFQNNQRDLMESGKKRMVSNRGGVFAVLPRAQDSLQHPYSEMQSEGTKNVRFGMEGETWMERFVSRFVAKKRGNTSEACQTLGVKLVPQRLNGAGVFTYTKFTPLSTFQFL